jgi:hypothetical protein
MRMKAFRARSKKVCVILYPLFINFFFNFFFFVASVVSAAALYQSLFLTDRNTQNQYGLFPPPRHPQGLGFAQLSLGSRILHQWVCSCYGHVSVLHSLSCSTNPLYIDSIISCAYIPLTLGEMYAIGEEILGLQMVDNGSSTGSAICSP